MNSPLLMVLMTFLILTILQETHESEKKWMETIKSQAMCQNLFRECLQRRLKDMSEGTMMWSDKEPPTWKLCQERVYAKHFCLPVSKEALKKVSGKNAKNGKSLMIWRRRKVRDLLGGVGVGGGGKKKGGGGGGLVGVGGGGKKKGGGGGGLVGVGGGGKKKGGGAGGLVGQKGRKTGLVGVTKDKKKKEQPARPGDVSFKGKQAISKSIKSILTTRK